MWWQSYKNGVTVARLCSCNSLNRTGSALTNVSLVVASLPICMLVKVFPVYSAILLDHIFLCLPSLLFSGTLLASESQFERFTWPHHLSFFVRPDYCQSCSGNKNGKLPYSQSWNQCAPSGFPVQISEQLWLLEIRNFLLPARAEIEWW